MGTYLHEDVEEFNLIVRVIEKEQGLKREFIIKDYFTVLALREIIARNPDVVFKGGTCLSKCYGVIDRFSEDIDLGLEVAHATEGMRKKLKKAVVGAMDALGLTIGNLDKTRSRREFNRYVVSLPLSPIEGDSLIIETAVMSPTAPTDRRVIVSFVGEYLAARGRDDLLEQFGLGPFDLTVNSLERTFCDKVFAVCDYVMGGESLHRQSRHIYDLYRLLGEVALDDSLLELLGGVRAQRVGGYRTPSAEPSVVLSEELRRLVREESYRADYDQVTSPLLYDDLGYDAAISSLTEIAAFLSKNGL
ncbi:nucleotidyl transferase AbiEii/AbiGii toxin family protein [uncultured Adlercreutzia sp.]|uniref:nucleotidyl transferase AbiEii/AbiGii toxin family protein n=1 Tax=uncultured Adlercreutzia sp. TaxID=875803 RepID=UPI0026F4018F|nr:nucleotidyl transferase AbiEii/AbiGii toxin family protein [uncultured Adlercreutzia sp.]